MKKKIIYSSVITTLLSISSVGLAGGQEVLPEPDYFSGFYIGGIGGVHHNLFNGSSSVILNSSIDVPATVTLTGPSVAQAVGFIELIPAGTLGEADIGGGEFNGYGGVQGGFGMMFSHQFYAGLQGFGAWGSSSETAVEISSGSVNNIPQIFVTLLPGDTLNIFGSVTSTTTMKINNDYGIAGKLGWVVAPRSMIYGKVGASWADIKVSNTTSAATSVVTFNAAAPAAILSSSVGSLSASSSNEQTKVGLLLAVGLEQFVYKDMFSVNIEYDYVNYGHVTTTTPDLTGTFTVLANAVPSAFPLGTYPATSTVTGQSTVSVITSSLMAGVNFYFGRDWL